MTGNNAASLRTFPANIPEVQVKGFEADLAPTLSRTLVMRAWVAYADGRYKDYPAGPCPLEWQNPNAIGGCHAHLGTGAAFLAGVLAAVVVTWFTFLPSFILVLASGPLVEATHGEVKLTAPLTGITAAVVGVIASLGTFFAYHVLWPGGLQGAFDWKSLLIAVAAAAALVRFKRSVVEVICGCAVAGLVVSVLV